MFQVEFTAWMYLSVLGADFFFFFLEIKLFWEIYLGHASFPCFPQIILTLHFLPLQLFFFFLEIRVLLKVTEGELFPDHVFMKNKNTNNKTHKFYFFFFWYLIFGSFLLTSDVKSPH